MRVVVVGIFLILSAVPSYAAEQMVLLMLGDSLTEGYGLTKEEAYPALVETELKKTFPNIRVINAGISGSTSASGESRLKWQLKNKPQILFLALGANDGLRGLSTDALRTNLEKTIQLAQRNNVYVILAGMKMPMNYGGDYRTKYENVYTDLARKYNLNFVPFLLEGVATDKKLNLPDGVHPNADGYKKIAKVLLPTLSAAVLKVQKEKGQ